MKTFVFCLFLVFHEVNSFIFSRQRYVNRKPIIQPRSNGKIVPGFMPQPLDHFAVNSTKWNQRFWYNTEFVRSANHPVFVRIEGEAGADSGWLHGGQWNDWARTYGALMFVLEHRYYGSKPTKDLSVENLKYLTSKQALADIANFVNTTNRLNNFTSDNKWVLFGGSYPGDLVAWARLHYPQLITGAVSSSGPLMAILNFKDYRDKGDRFGLNYFSPGCADSLHDGMAATQALLESGNAEDLKTLKSKFRLCSVTNVSNWQDRVMFYTQLGDQISIMVQDNDPGYPEKTIKYFCSNYLNNQSISKPIDRLSAFAKAYIKSCPYDYKSDVENNRYSDYIDNYYVRQWMWQTCNEFGWFFTSEGKNSLMGDTIPLKFYTQQCTDTFGNTLNETQLTAAINDNNASNKGVDINTTNIVFLQGNIDPWRFAGTIRNPTKDMPFVLINGTSHTYDMQDYRADDPPSLTAARNLAKTYIGKWVAS